MVRNCHTLGMCSKVQLCPGWPSIMRNPPLHRSAVSRPTCEILLQFFFWRDHYNFSFPKMWNILMTFHHLTTILLLLENASGSSNPCVHCLCWTYNNKYHDKFFKYVFSLSCFPNILSNVFPARARHRLSAPLTGDLSPSVAVQLRAGWICSHFNNILFI